MPKLYPVSGYVARPAATAVTAYRFFLVSSVTFVISRVVKEVGETLRVRMRTNAKEKESEAKLALVDMIQNKPELTTDQVVQILADQDWFYFGDV